MAGSPAHLLMAGLILDIKNTEDPAISRADLLGLR
jgi:hypothetical protein